MLGARLSENRGEVKGLPRGSEDIEKKLDIFPYGNVMLRHGTSGDNFGCVQRGGGAAQAADSQLSGPAGAARRGDCGLAGDGAAVGVEASAGVCGSGARQRAAGRAAYALSNQRRGDPSTSRVDGNVRALLASSIKPHKGARRKERQSVKRFRARFYSTEEK